MPDTTLSNSIQGMYSLPIANFGRRFGAAFLDLLLLTFLVFLLKFAFPDFSNILFFKKATPFMTNNATNWVLSRSSLIGVWIIYSMIMESTAMQGTIGKQVMGIMVADIEGNRITLPRSIGRNLFKIVSYAILGLGFVYVLLDNKRRGWHDIVANTLVIQK